MEKEHGMMEWADKPFWYGFMKKAVVKIPKTLPKMPKLPASEGPPLGVPRMTNISETAAKTTKPAAEPINYAKMNEIIRKPSATLKYNSRGAQEYVPPPKP